MRSLAPISVALSILLAGCDTAIEPAEPAEPQRATPVQVVTATDAAKAEIIRANSAFAADLYSVLREKRSGGNLFFSPASISTAFGLAYAGAAGETEKEIARVLHFDGLAQSDFHPAHGQL